MSKLAKLRGDSEEIRIKDVVLEVRPIPFRIFTKAMEHYDKGENMRAVEIMVYETLRQAIPTDGEDGVNDTELQAEIDALPPSIILELVKIIQKVNGLETDASASKKDS